MRFLRSDFVKGLSIVNYLITLVRLIMTGYIVAGKNNGGRDMAELPK